MDYALVIADIPHGFNIPNIYYDGDPYTYQAFNKVVAGKQIQGENKFKDAAYMVRCLKCIFD